LCEKGGGRRLASVNKEVAMSTVARITTISSRSTDGFEAAVREGVERANSTLRNVTGAWVKEQSVECANGAITSFSVVLEVTFVLDD
jgi:flavin-binding protein dodecin